MKLKSSSKNFPTQPSKILGDGAVPTAATLFREGLEGRSERITIDLILWNKNPPFYCKGVRSYTWCESTICRRRLICIHAWVTAYIGLRCEAAMLECLHFSPSLQILGNPLASGILLDHRICSKSSSGFSTRPFHSLQNLATMAPSTTRWSAPTVICTYGKDWGITVSENPSIGGLFWVKRVSQQAYIDYGWRVNIFVIIKARKFLNAPQGNDGNFRQVQKWRAELATNGAYVAKCYGAAFNIHSA